MSKLGDLLKSDFALDNQIFEAVHHNIVSFGLIDLAES